MEQKKCKICGKVFNKRPNQSKKIWETTVKYCSAKCQHKAIKGLHSSPSTEFKKGRKNTGYSFKKGHIPWSKGKSNPFVTGELHKGWKGDNVSYDGLHRWVTRWKGKPKKCEMCGTTKSKRFEWANVDHLYKRILDDYIRLCTSCHRRFDYSKK